MSKQHILDRLFNAVIMYRGKHFNLVTYGFLYALAFFLVLQLFFTNWYRLGYSLSPAFLLFCSIVVPFSIPLGAKMLYLLYNIKRLIKKPLEVINETGYAFFGSFVGIAVCGLLIGRYFFPGQGIRILDMVCLFLPLGQILQRIGCATYGCCYGHPYSGPLAIVYKNPEAKAFRSGGMGNTPLHPTPLYSILKNLFIFVIINIIFIKFPYQGVPTALWLILYGTLRFFVDFTRFIQPPYLLGIRITQILSVIMVLAGLTVLLRTELIIYQFIFSFREGLMNSLSYIPYTLMGSLIMLLAYGFHSKELGHYIKTKK